MNQLPSMARRRAMRARSAALREVELTAARIGRATQAAHSTVALGDEDVPLVEAVDSAVAVSAELPLVSEETGLAGDDAWDAWDQSDFAKQLAADAAQVAQDAQTSADGKSRVVRSTSEATAAGSYKEGDQWWQFSGANIVGLWLHDGAGWVQQVVTSQVIASLDAGKITTGVLAADRIGTNSITTAKLASTAIDGMTITGAVMRTAPSGQRMQFDATGLRAFNSAGAAVATLLSSGGSLTLNGALSLLDGANESGSVSANGLQTSLSAYPRAGATRSNGFRHTTDALTTSGDVKFGIFSGRAGRFEVSSQYTNDLGPFKGRVTVNTEAGAELNMYSRQTASSPQVEFGIRPLGTDGYFVGCHPMSYMRFAESEIEFRSQVKFQGDTAPLPWSNFGTYGAGWSDLIAAPYEGVKAQVKGGMFYLDIALKKASGHEGSEVILRINSIYRPKAPKMQFAWVSGANFVVAQPDGNVIVAVARAGSGNLTAASLAWPLS